MQGWWVRMAIAAPPMGAERSWKGARHDGAGERPSRAKQAAGIRCQLSSEHGRVGADS